MTRDQRLVAAIASFLTLPFLSLACSEPGADPDPPSRSAPVWDRDLGLGSRGESVLALHDYLTRYGYFPNPGLQREYPAWRPIVPEAPADATAFDEQTAAGVRALQQNSGLPVTGIVDEATRTMLQLSRCGVPDGMSRADASDKFGHAGSKWSHPDSLSWKLINTNDVGYPDAETAVRNAFASWAAQAPLLSFNEIPANGATADIEIQFATFAANDNALARAAYPSGGGDIRVNSSYAWSVNFAANTFDLQSVVVHEIGHSMGLTHTSVGTAGTMQPAMWSGMPLRTNLRNLQVDDKAAISSLYASWEVLPGLARDIAVGGTTRANEQAWVIGKCPNPDCSIFKWNEGAHNWNWDLSGGLATTIAVDPGGIPWVVNSAGNIYRYSNNNPNTGSWSPVTGTARDIGIGSDGSVWIISTIALGGGDYKLRKWNGSGWTDLVEAGGGVRIAVNGAGLAWVVTAANAIKSRSQANPAIGGWVPQGNSGTDVGISDTGSLGIVVGTNALPGGAGVFLRDWQVARAGNDTSGSETPFEDTWIDMQAPGSVRLSVGPLARPWLIDSNGNISRQVRTN